jgi:transcription initiation factor TFIID TATA-box-binding protein
MSQRIIFETLQSIENNATYEELKKAIKNSYPSRTLDEYLGLRLSSLVEKNAVLKDTINGESVYRINPDYSPEDFGISLLDLKRDVDRTDLRSHGIVISNIVGSGTFCNSIDLKYLSMELENIEYEPETSPLAILRPFDNKSVAGLITATGKVTIVGGKTSEDIRDSIDYLYNKVSHMGNNIVEKSIFVKDFQIHNIAASASLCRELELSAVAVGLGLEDTEYDPDKFPGIVYRLEPGITTIIFRSGSVVITGSSYLNILEGWQELCDDLEQIGVKINRK